MKICVFSDSHGCPANLIQAVETEQPSFCFFLGDGEKDVQALGKRFPNLPVYTVRGNCDLRSEQPRQLRCAVDGVTFFAPHGHLYDVKHDSSLSELCREAEGADVVLFGHTHIPTLEKRDGMEILNPGSIGRSAHPSYGVIMTGGGGVRAEIRYLR